MVGKMISRRNFLKTISLTPFVLSSKISLAENKDFGYFLFVLLKGGADSLSMLIPYSDPLYGKHRQKLSINSNDYSVISDTWAVNNLLKDTYYDWWKEGYAHYYPLAGQNNNTRSHFNSQETLQIGTDHANGETGLFTRLRKVKPELKIITFSENKPLISKGDLGEIPNLSTTFIRNNFKSNEIKSDYYKNYFGKNDNSINRNQEILNNLKAQNTSNISNMALAARVMKENNYNIGFVEIEGWDTHGNQEAYLQTRLSDLNKQLLDFKDIMKEDWDKTTIFILSEFGRTVYANYDGTEHGWGGLGAVFDGSFKKSEIISDWNGLEELHEDRELLMKDNYKDILFQIFQKKYNLPKSDKRKIFPE